jgi:hypothetical protein
VLVTVFFGKLTNALFTYEKNLNFVELCKICTKQELVFPCWETMATRLELPMGYYVFYHYFLKAAVGEEEWKQLARDFTTDDGSTKMSSELNEGFALVLLKNNYFAWLMEAKQLEKGLMTDYDGEEVVCGKTSLVEHVTAGVFIDLEADRVEDDYLVLPVKRDSGSEDECLETVLKRATHAKAKKIYDQQLDSLRESVRMSPEYKSVLTSLDKIKDDECDLDEKGRKQKKRRIMKDLKVYTARLGGEKAFRGWSVRAYTEMAKQRGAIAKEHDKYRMFDRAYRHVNAMQQKVPTASAEIETLISDNVYDALFDLPNTVCVV